MRPRRRKRRPLGMTVDRKLTTGSIVLGLVGAGMVALGVVLGPKP